MTFRDDDSYFTLPPEDRSRFPAAEGMLKAWGALSEDDRHGAAGAAMLQLAPSLLSSPAGKTELAQLGMEMSLDLDDPRGLRLFLSQGAELPPLFAPEPGHSSGYSAAWEGNLTQWCVRHERLRCFEALAEMGRLEQERSLAAPFLKEPEPSPLAQVDRAFLTRHQPTLADEDAGTDLILLLLRGMQDQSAYLGLQISEAELRRGNPLFALLWRARDGQAEERPLELLDRAAFEHRLFEPELASHRHALLGAVADGSVGALYLALKAGLSPDEPGLLRERELAVALARRSGSDDPAAQSWMALAERFFEPWAACQEPLIQERALGALVDATLSGRSHERAQSAATLERLCQAWAKGESPSALLPPPRGEAARERLDRLSQALLEGVERARQSEAESSEPRKAREAKEEWDRSERLIQRAIAALQPLSSAPRAPSRRV